MKKILGYVIFLIAAVLFLQPVLAGEIIFTAESPVIYNSTDEEISIGLGVENTIGEDVYGSFTWTVRDRNDADNTRSSTDARVIFADAVRTSFAIQPADGHEYLVDVAFDYADSVNADDAYHVSLTGIRVIPGTSANVPDASVLESVQIRMDKGSSQQSGTQESGSESVGSEGVLVKKTDENLESLSKMLEDETNNLIVEKSRLRGVVNGSEIYPVIDQFLNKSGYNSGVLSISPGLGAYNDEFEQVYSGENESEIKVSGEISGDEILFTGIESEGRMPLLYGVEENATYISLDSEFSGEGYSVTKSAMNITGNASQIGITYTKGIFEKDIAVLVSDGAIISVEVSEPDYGIHFIVPVIVIILTVVCAFVFYRVYLRHLRRTKPGPDDGDIPGRVEAGISPSDLLAEGYDRYLCGDLKDAIGMVGWALRLNVSVTSGENASLTNSEALSQLEKAGDPDTGTYSDIFSVCDSVVYANREPEKGEFIRIYETAKRLVDKTVRSGNEEIQEE
ncbi:hypothetical protein Mpet_1224 [Methanolacinia petrolearia DSM 11571]|uniref:DUF4129 domain-containing protein n=1 Tax=Methanolacinia petrolearia (strain DSM 11571 / OCM 486 / SEBR 4847) TaxID=679926 RepID=E1RDN2_METP4|nr:hypothetical protein [Methanolacinia petrolearia]ADN35985.1 hypothetical protein Mpet_1224 [Methanolacinia petrolearia DSM 11571]